VGLLWEMHQQRRMRRIGMRSQLQNMDQNQRLAELERQVDELEEFVGQIVRRLEEKLGEDLDRDGKIG
jgi:hypothetical protein